MSFLTPDQRPLFFIPDKCTPGSYKRNVTESGDSKTPSSPQHQDSKGAKPPPSPQRTDGKAPRPPDSAAPRDPPRPGGRTKEKSGSGDGNASDSSSGPVRPFTKTNFDCE